MLDTAYADTIGMRKAVRLPADRCVLAPWLFMRDDGLYGEEEDFVRVHGELRAQPDR